MKNLVFLLAFASLLLSCSKDDDAPSIKKITVSEGEIKQDEITIVWPKVEGAIYYEVSITPGTEDDINIVENKNIFKYSNLLANTEYVINVKAGTSFATENIIAEGEQTIKTLALPQQIIGTWKFENQTSSVIYVFNADGTGSYKYTTELPIKWKADDTSITITKFYSSGTSQTATYEYTFTDKGVLNFDGLDYFLED